jgi:hypothetical protein
MRSAPSVVYPVGRCFFQGCLLLALCALGLAVLIGWALSASGRFFGESFWVGLGLWVLWSAVVFKVWWCTPMGALQWDSLATPQDETPRGGAWLWHAKKTVDAAPLHSIECVLDCQNWMLLRLLRPARVANWVWVERGRAPALWGDMRRALMATRVR